MNLPNRLTLLRIFFVPLLVATLVTDTREIRVAGLALASEYVALAIFWAAAATDLLDGYLARRWKQVTTVGILLDPIADKLLVSSALISLVQKQAVPGWMAILVIGREFAVSGLRSIASSKGLTIPASDLGKTKMLAQVIAISMLMIALRHPDMHGFAMAWMWAVMVFGVLSALQYFRSFWKTLDEGIKAASRQELLELERQRRRQQRQLRRAHASGHRV